MDIFFFFWRGETTKMAILFFLKTTMMAIFFENYEDGYFFRKPGRWPFFFRKQEDGYFDSYS